MMSYQKSEIYEMLKELKDCLNTVNDINKKSYPVNEDLEEFDNARNRGIEITENLKNAKVDWYKLFFEKD